jgi:hypothetical protein
MEIAAGLNQLHGKIIDFGSLLQKTSNLKKQRENHIGNNVYGVFYKINAFAITLHRAVITLCEGGWSHTTPLLIRAILECSANCLALINNDSPEYMAFKYLYFPYLEILKDKGSSEELKAKIVTDLETGLNNITDSEVKRRAEEFVDGKEIFNRWFMKEEKSITSIVKKYGGEEMLFVYGALSTATHGYHFGMGLFKDNSDIVTINPMENPERSKAAILFSSRHLLEHLHIRNQYETLGLESEYSSLLDKILSFKKER